MKKKKLEYRINEDYVSFETAKLLKKAGFNELCRTSYGNAYLHNGEYIDEDEEFELKEEGKESEIEILKGGSIYGFWNDNNSNPKSVYSRPTLQMAMKWLRETYKFFIDIQCYGCESNRKAHFEYSYVISECIKVKTEICTVAETVERKCKAHFLSYEKACDEALKYALKNMV